MPTNDDIFRAFSRDFFSKLLATPIQLENEEEGKKHFTQISTVYKNI